MISCTSLVLLLVPCLLVEAVLGQQQQQKEEETLNSIGQSKLTCPSEIPSSHLASTATSPAPSPPPHGFARVAALKRKIKSMVEFSERARFTQEGKAAHDAKIAALQVQVVDAIAAGGGGGQKNGNQKSISNQEEGVGKRWKWGKFPQPHVQLAKARKLVQAGIEAAAAIARSQQGINPGRVDTTSWPLPEACEIKHYIEDKLGKVAVVNVKRRNKWGLNGTTAALVVRNRTGVRLIEQDSLDPPEGTGCGRNRHKGYRGFEDPRLLVWNNAHLVLVNGCYNGGRHMFLYRVDLGVVVRLRVVGGAGGMDGEGADGRDGVDHNSSNDGQDMVRSALSNAEDKDAVEKNWTPYVSRDGSLRFIYSFGRQKALAVLELTDIASGACVLVHGTLMYDKAVPALGSTPLIPWQLPWYAGVAHTRGRAQDFRQLQPELLSDGSVVERNNPSAVQHRYRRTYRSVPMIYNSKTFEVRFGPPVEFARPSTPLADPWARDGQTDIFRDVQFAFDIQVKDDSVHVGIDFQDRCPANVHLPLKHFCALLPAITTDEE